MRFDVLTLFPQMCRAAADESILGRAQNSGAIEIHVTDIRQYADNKHHKVDDYPYGGGRGMVMAVQPVESAIAAIEKEIGEKPYVIYMSPKGSLFNQNKAVELSARKNITLLCGHYEGIDQRIIDSLVDEELSVGDYVLTGGELPAMIVVDSVSRMIDGVLAGEECYEDESIYSGLLEYPHYTRPADYKGMQVPDVLLSGHDRNISIWRRRQALDITLARRPDLLDIDRLSKEDILYLKEKGWCDDGKKA